MIDILIALLRIALGILYCVMFVGGCIILYALFLPDPPPKCPYCNQYKKEASITGITGNTLYYCDRPSCVIRTGYEPNVDLA